MLSDTTKGRLYLLATAVLWSVSGVVIKHLGHVPHEAIAFYRSLFAGLVLLPLVRRKTIGWHPLLLVMVPFYAVMLFTFVAATANTSAANAIILQYTAPVYIFAFCVLVLRERVVRDNVVALAAGTIGVAVIFFSSRSADTVGILFSLASGVAFAAVTVCLRLLRTLSPLWLALLGNLVGAVAMLPIVWGHLGMDWPMLGFLAAFGAVQIALPYVLFAKGLQYTSAQEAGLICLIEPILNPLWVAASGVELPSVGTIVGGVLILGGLAWRYRPGGNAGSCPGQDDPHEHAQVRVPR